jgi:hypothetical protein
MFGMDSFWNGSICIGQCGIVHSIMFIMFSLKWFCNGMVHFVISIMANNTMVHFVMSTMVSNGMVHSIMFGMVNNGVVHYVMFTMFTLKWICL